MNVAHGPQWLQRFAPVLRVLAPLTDRLGYLIARLLNRERTR